MQFSFLKDIQERNKAKQQAVKFNVGGQDQIDLISYSGLEEQSNYLVLGNKFVRTLFVSGYPYTASTGRVQV